MKALLIRNPGSRSGRSRGLWALWESGLREARVSFDCVDTRGAGDAFRAARRPGDHDVIVPVGGDGTINEVLDGVAQSGRPDLRMGVLYSGTSPDFCRFHGIPVEPRQALERLLAGVARKVDIVRIAYRAEDGTQRTAHFGCSCNIGMGALVAGFANRIRSVWGDTLGTGIAVLHAIAISRPVDLTLEVDGEALRLSRVNHLFVLKNPYVASGLRLNVPLEPDDGRLFVLAVRGKSPAGLLWSLPRFYTGTAGTNGEFFRREATRVTITSDGTEAVEFDGDPRGYLPATAEVMPRSLNLIGGRHE